MRPPLQSRKDIVNIGPFNRKIVTPTIDTTTGCDDLLSGSGGVINIVRTDPRLVPTQRVGVKTVGSAKKNVSVIIFKISITDIHSISIET